jgi:hypothetical protein
MTLDHFMTDLKDHRLHDDGPIAEAMARKGVEP